MLRADDFYMRQNQALYQAVFTMFNQFKTIDLVTVIDQMKADGAYDEVDEAGGYAGELPALGLELLHGVPHAAHDGGDVAHALGLALADGVYALFRRLQMSKEQLGMRLVATECLMDNKKLATGRIVGEEGAGRPPGSRWRGTAGTGRSPAHLPQPVPIRRRGRVLMGDGFRFGLIPPGSGVLCALSGAPAAPGCPSGR